MNIQAVRTWVMQSPQHRFFALASGIVIAAACGWGLGKAFVWLFGNDAALAAIKTVTTAAIVFAVWKIALDHAANIASFVRAGATTNIRRAFIELIVAMIGLGVAAGTSGSGPLPRPPSLVAMSFVQPMDPFVDRVVLPVFTANLSEGAKLACDASPENPALQRLATVDSNAIGVIQEVACGLRACSTGPAVVIDVQGFASSEPFDFVRNRVCPNSQQMNHVLAEMRRAAVLEILDGDVSQVENCQSRNGLPPPLLGQLDVEPQREGYRWASPAAMEAERVWTHVADGSGTITNRGREILTRRVDIVIRSKGSCATAARTLAAR